MKHVWIGDHDVSLEPNGPTRIVGSVSIVCVDLQRKGQFGEEILKFDHLILSQGLGRKNIKGPLCRIRYLVIHNRKVVAERFARSGWRDNDDIFTFMDNLNGLSLMRIEPRDASLF